MVGLEAGADQLAGAGAQPRKELVPPRNGDLLGEDRPIDARTASTDQGSALSSTRISPPAPVASPVLRIVPMFPGSRSACATIHRGEADRSIESSEVSGWR